VSDGQALGWGSGKSRKHSEKGDLGLYRGSFCGLLWVSGVRRAYFTISDVIYSLIIFSFFAEI